MIKPVFRVVGLDQATCEAEYCGTETATKPASTELFAPRLFTPDDTITSETLPAKSVSVRVRDFFPALQQAVDGRLAWINDFADDTVIIPQDLHDVLVTFQRLKRAA
jgi:hypothetical protein